MGIRATSVPNNRFHTKLFNLHIRHCLFSYQLDEANGGLLCYVSINLAVLFNFMHFGEIKAGCMNASNGDLARGGLFYSVPALSPELAVIIIFVARSL